ncbi:MAG: Ig-like domain-containing protein [Ignavibacteriales bacterium]|nr:Ig-like domain-containing protein [Ignavibacteriales bacterium]
MKIGFKLPTAQSILKSMLLSIVLMASFYCAGIRSPSGGPPDTTPPVIVETYPEAGTLHFNDNRFAFSFSKYVSRRTLQESFFISPPLDEFTFEWDGKDVEIFFSDSLRNSTTYIITIGTDVTDTRNNRLAMSFSLPFSTGDKIDSASIAGAVIDEKPEGVMIFAYPIEAHSLDTLNPIQTKPTYLTQTGKDGSFLLPYLAFGTYRVIAIRDQYKNLLYDPQIDEYGVYTSDIELNPSKPDRTDLQFRLTSEDTARPFLSSARSLDKIHVLMRFSESIDISSLTIDSITILDTLSGDQLNVMDASFVEKSRKEVQLVTDHQEIGRTYRVKVVGCRDIFGNQIPTQLNIAEFIAGITPDTSLPKFDILNVRNNSANVPIDDSIHILFDEAVKKEPFEEGFRLQDSSKANIKGVFQWLSSAEVYFIPNFQLSLGMSYTLNISLDSVIDYAGNRFTDTTFTLKFQTIEEKLLSGLSGTVSDDIQAGSGRIDIVAKNVVKKESDSYMQRIDGPGNFKFKYLVEGKYVLTAFRDTDSNGVYSYGKPFPYVPSERFIIYPDTLKLRARWPLEGVSIHFK